MKSVLVLSFLLVNTISQIVPECKSLKLATMKNHIIKRHQGLSNARQIDFTKYNKYPVIEKFLISLRNQPSVGPSGKGKIFAYSEGIGKTVENRTIHLIKIFKKKNGGCGKRRRKMKPAILIDGGIHAREWISPAVVLYIINQLKNNPTEDPAIEKLVDMYDWYIIPVLNPDGYVYSYTTDPCWRKNRRQTDPNNAECLGVDLNRNFGFDDESWNPAVGGSRDPCNYEIFAGDGPFTEEESKALRKVMDKNKKKIVNFLANWTFHNYLQIIAYPIGYKLKELADKKDLQDAGKVAAAAIKKKHQKEYIVDQSASIQQFGGLIAGASDDYARGGANIKYSYTIELRDTGTKKFFLPATEIIPNGEEILEGVKAFANHIYKHR